MENTTRIEKQTGHKCKQFFFFKLIQFVIKSLVVFQNHLEKSILGLYSFTAILENRLLIFCQLNVWHGTMKDIEDACCLLLHGVSVVYT